MQNINRHRWGPNWRPKGEDEALDLLYFMRKIHTAQRHRGGRSHHEQSDKSRAPHVNGTWPWALSKDFINTSVKVAGCSVGLQDDQGNLMSKAWRVETSFEPLRLAFGPFKCSENLVDI